MWLKYTNNPHWHLSRGLHHAKISTDTMHDVVVHNTDECAQYDVKVRVADVLSMDMQYCTSYC
jgi:hypothetical protein